MTQRLPVNPDYQAIRDTAAPLNEKLAAYAVSLRARNEAVADAYQAFVDTLIAADAGTGGPKVGDKLEAFLLPDETGTLVSSKSLLARGPLVLSFNRGHWCPFCWLELGALAEANGMVRSFGGSIVSVTPDVQPYAKALRDDLGLPFQVLCDVDNGYALEIGLAVALSADIRRLLAPIRDLGTFQRNQSWFVPIPSTLVIDSTGIVRQVSANRDFRTRSDPSVLADILSDLS